LVVTNVNTSTLLRVDVRVGAVPPGHFTAPPHVIARAVPSAVRIRVNAPPEPDAGGFWIVKVVIAAFKLTVKMLEVSKFSVKVPAEMAGLEIVSE
jgi:hypothetical protein